MPSFRRYARNGAHVVRPGTWGSNSPALENESDRRRRRFEGKEVVPFQRVVMLDAMVEDYDLGFLYRYFLRYIMRTSTGEHYNSYDSNAQEA